MITKNNQSKVRSFSGKILEPLALGLLALLFIIPALTVMNLKPLTKDTKDFSNVLGVTTNSQIIVDLIGGTHEILSVEKIYKDGESGYRYGTLLAQRDSDFYSKPILQITNNTNEEKILTFLGSTLHPTQSKIGLIINDQAYGLQDSTGQSELVEILLKPRVAYDIYLTVENTVDIQFSEEFEMKIGIK
ncbi:hypothetical protein K8R20_03055 [bacterium]|nr:hypothetical protein [bacterium]